MAKRKANDAELRTIGVLLVMQLRGDAVTAESLEQANEGVDDLTEFTEAWLRSKHGGDSVDDSEAKWLDTAAGLICHRI